jgi:hypothetical protein
MKSPHLPRYTLGGHINLGVNLKEARELVHRLLIDCPTTTPPGRDAMQSLRAIDRLIDTLDGEAAKLIPADRDPRHLAGLIYYGQERLRSREYDPRELTTDVFAPWAAERW